MLDTINRRRTWLQTMLNWWQQRHSAPIYQSQLRRFPIPPACAHLYARAADEFT